jgi:hypothetical protein
MTERNEKQDTKGLRSATEGPIRLLGVFISIPLNAEVAGLTTLSGLSAPDLLAIV